MAEILFKKIKGSEHKVFSAGTKVNEKNKLKEIPLAEPVIRFMKEEGYDISNNYPKQITKKMVREADKIIVMAEKDTLPAFLINNPKAILWNIEDPKGKSDEHYKLLINQLKTNIKGM